MGSSCLVNIMKDYGINMRDNNKNFNRFINKKWVENCYERDAYNLKTYSEKEYLEFNRQFLNDLYEAEVEHQRIINDAKALK